MGIIKLKNANEEQAKNIAIDEQPVYGVDVEVNENTDIPQGNQEQCQDPAVLYEDESRTDEHARHYVMNNGTAKSVFNAESVSYFDEEAKKWKPIDNSLKENADAYESKNGNMRTKIYKENKGKKVEIAKSDKQLSWEYLGKQAETVSVANENVETFSASVLKVNNDLAGESKNINSSAVYENIEKDTDLEYCLRGNNLKENIIVREKSADYRYIFALKTEGLKIRLSEDNESLELYTERTKDDGTVEQKVEFTIPAPFMYDANGESSDDVYYELEPSENGNYAFAVVASDEWINAAERAFPVTIDPQIVTDNSSLITKQVQYRVVSTGSGSGSSTGSWTNTSSSDIRVYKSNSIEYRTCLTIKRSLMNLPNNRIVGVKLIMSPSSNFEGYLIVNNTYKHYKSSAGKLEQDITGIFKRYTSDFTINIEPSYYPYEYINGYFSMSANPPVIEVEYLTNENTKPVKKIFSLAGVAAANVNLATGDMVTSFCDIDGDRSVKGVEIKHVYKKDGANFFCGNNFRLNIQEKFVKNSSGVLDANYIYTDADGDKHGFRDYYYYIDRNGKKNYISSKSSIVVEADGTLKYNGYNVACEYKSASGLKAITQIGNLKNVAYYEQRSDEYKEICGKVKSYKDYLSQYILVNGDNGNTIRPLREKIDSTDNFQSFINEANNYSNYIPLSESEQATYKNLLLQKTSLWNQSTSLNNQNILLDYALIDYDTQYKSLDNALDPTKESCKDVDKQKEIINAQKQNASNRYTFMGSQRREIDTSKNFNDDQLKITKEQISTFVQKKAQTLQTLQEYYKEYAALLVKKKTYELKQPVNFLTDGKIYKGYNESGNLVAIFDAYENNVVIEYEQYYIGNAFGERIARMYDNDNNVVTFSYTPDNKLSCITDRNGRNTRYVYDSGSNLKEVIFDIGDKINITYYGNYITSIAEEKNKLYANISYSGGKPTVITNGSSVGNVVKDKKCSSTNTVIDTVNLTFVQNSNLTMNYVTISTDKSRERYYFDEDNNAKEYRLEEGGEMSKAEKYSYTPYWKGSTAQSDPKIVTTSTTKASLFGKTLENFVFESGDTETTTLNQFENAIKTITSPKKVNADGTNTLTVTTEFTYDDNQKLVEEVTTETYSKDNKSIVSHTKYNYNYAGNIVRKETYVEGEEITKGKTVEETVYDNKGNVKKAFTYNTLDSSSKFYSSETEYDETGKTLADYDATGENKTKYCYKDGTTVVRETVLPNGSKFAYGHDADDTVTSITQSTEDGEGNSTQKIYRHGEVVELSSGNNTVKYEYDGKRRTTKVFLNDDKNAYCENSYTDTTLNGVAVEKCESKNANKAITVSYTDKLGNLRRVEQSDGKVLQYDYEHGKIKNIKNGSGLTIESVAYDELDRQTSHTFNGNVHTTEYNDYGQTAKETVKFGGSIEDKLEYAYSYKENAARTLAGLTIGAFGENYEQDKNGRSVKIMQTLGGQTYTKRFGYYKQGDHATSRVNTIYYSKNGISDGKVTYTYDGMGNIISVNENGKQRYKYAYDKIGRLISEKDLDGNREICYTYDNSGNILTKIDNGTITDYRYKDGTDRLMSFGTELFAYDDMGNPTTYRNMSCMWEKGRQLKSISDGANTVSFTYDEFGMRTTKTAGGITMNYVYENGKLLREVTGSEKIDFVYGSDGIIGFRTGNKNYLYRKNVFGDVTEIYSDNGTLVGKYSYTAFGECIVKVNEGGIAEKNPIRYRGYYYDEEMSLYYLKSRYYDPVTGRFITIDDISYIDPETINGLNLYAYCNNNPVSNVDPNGNKWWHWLIGAIIIIGLGVATALTGGAAGVILGSAFYGAITGAVSSAVIGGVIGGISSVVSGDGFFGGFIEGASTGFMSGALIGGAIGALTAGINIATGAVKIVGSAQKTGTFFHRFASNVSAGKMAMQVGRYSQITLDRSLNKAGMVGRKMPDVMGKARWGRDLIVEVTSKSQTHAQMASKLKLISIDNPTARTKIIDLAAWIGRHLF